MIALAVLVGLVVGVQVGRWWSNSLGYNVRYVIRTLERHADQRPGRTTRASRTPGHSEGGESHE